MSDSTAPLLQAKDSAARHMTRLRQLQQQCQALLLHESALQVCWYFHVLVAFLQV